MTSPRLPNYISSIQVMNWYVQCLWTPNLNSAERESDYSVWVRCPLTSNYLGAGEQGLCSDKSIAKGYFCGQRNAASLEGRLWAEQMTSSLQLIDVIPMPCYFLDSFCSGPKSLVRFWCPVVPTKSGCCFPPQILQFLPKVVPSL